MFKDKLREIICQLPDNRKELKEIKLWCIIDDITNGTWLSQVLWYLNKFVVLKRFSDITKPFFERKADVEKMRIIWNQITERNIRLYCASKKIKVLQFTSWLMELDNWWIIKSIPVNDLYDFDNQSEEIYKMFYLYFLNWK